MTPGLRAGRTVSSIPFGFDRNGRPLRPWRRRKDLSLRSSVLYPVVDGPGIALMVFLPPFLTIMAVPVFDMMVHFQPGNALNPINLMIVPFTLPLVTCFTLTVGYVLIFLGRIVTTSASGEVDHPQFPTWDRVEILEELARWAWASLTGLAFGGIPAWFYWANCGEVDRLDLALFAGLAILGACFAQLALVASLLCETLWVANPITVARSMSRIDRDYVAPCLVTGLALATILAAWSSVLLHSPSLEVGIVGLWGCWVLTLYGAMVALRVLGTVYYKHADRLGWFRTYRA